MQTQDLAWLDACFVEKVLQKLERDEFLRVSNITVTPGAPKGSNLTTDIYRISFEVLQTHDENNIVKTRSFIIKVGYYNHSNKFKKMMMDAGVFQTETSMFLETLPVINQILADAGLASLSPRCLQADCSKEPMHVIIEDLAPSGFRLITNLYGGLDLKHSLLAIRKLAVFHATSVALVDKDPTAPLMKHTAGLYHKKRPAIYATRMILSMKILAKEVAKWSELSPRIAEKIAKLTDSIHEKACNVSRYCKDDFNVLVHGDFSQANVMFRYDEQQQPIDVKFVDFQLSYYGSLAIDIFHFFGLAVEDNVRLNHRDLLLREYYDSLVSTMAKLKCVTAIPSFGDLQKILKERGFYEVVITFTVFSLARCPQESTEPTILDERYNGPPLYKYGGESYRKIMTQLLPLYDNMGFLDL